MKLTKKKSTVAVTSAAAVVAITGGAVLANSFLVNGATPMQDDIATGTSPVLACQDDLPVDLVAAPYDAQLAGHPVVAAETLAADGCVGYAATVTLLDSAGAVLGTCGDHDLLSGKLDTLTCTDAILTSAVAETVLLVDRPSEIVTPVTTLDFFSMVPWSNSGMHEEWNALLGRTENPEFFTTLASHAELLTDVTFEGQTYEFAHLVRVAAPNDPPAAELSLYGIAYDHMTLFRTPDGALHYEGNSTEMGDVWELVLVDTNGDSVASDLSQIGAFGVYAYDLSYWR